METKSCRILFMGTSEISSYVLESLILANYNVVGAISQPDKAVGRKKILTPTSVKLVCQKYHINCYQPIKIRNDFEFVKDLKPDVIVTFAYGQIVPQELLDIPTIGSINLHGSILPKLRGAAPIQRAIINGDKITGITLMEMVNKMDAGKMYAKKYLNIDDDDNSTTLFNKMKILAKDVILEYLPLYINGSLKGEEQDESQVSFANMIKKDDEKLKLDLTCKQFINWVRGLSENPGGYLYFKNKKLILYKVKLSLLSPSNCLGEIINADKNSLTFSLKDGAIDILELKLEGKNKMSYKDFVNGHHDLLGEILS